MDMFYLCDNFHLSFFLHEAMVRLTLLVVMLTPASMFMKLSRSFQIFFAPIFTKDIILIVLFLVELQWLCGLSWGSTLPDELRPRRRLRPGPGLRTPRPNQQVGSGFGRNISLPSLLKQFIHIFTYLNSLTLQPLQSLETKASFHVPQIISVSL